MWHLRILILPTTALQSLVAEEFGRSWIPSLLQNSSISTTTLQRIPQALSPGVAFTRYDLRPFGPPIATPAVSIGQTYLIILSFSFTFFLPIHMKYNAPKSYPPLHFCQLIIWRWVATVVSYFFLSCVYSLMSLAFLMPMSNPPTSHTEPAVNPNVYSYGTFVVYWMINWVAMTAFQLACENMAMLLGTPWTALWLIFWVVSNVTTGFYSLPLSSVFYRWGYAWPMHSGNLISFIAPRFAITSLGRLANFPPQSSKLHVQVSLISIPALASTSAFYSFGALSTPRYSHLHASTCTGEPFERRKWLLSEKQNGKKRCERTNHVCSRG